MKQFERALWAVIFVCVVLVALLKPGLIRFWPFTGTEFVQLMTPLLFVALVIERTLEVFVTAWRGGEEAQLKAFANLAESSQTARPKGPPMPAEPILSLVAYKSATQRLAFLFGVALGVIAAALGMRVLELFLDPAVFASLSESQRALFHGFDVLLSGTLLGGGSDGMHKLISVFTDFLDKTRRNLQQK